MAWAIQIIKAKPNPAGKDTGWGASRQEQLLGEWVDLRNIGDREVMLSSIHLAHTEFLEGCVTSNKASVYWNGRSDQMLLPGQILRVHTGKSSYSAQMQLVDSSGAHVHVYAESGNFLLNNRCGDTISVWWKNRAGEWVCEDSAYYASRPPEGKVLVRTGNQLV